jgi:hypothetical protein
MTTLAIRKKLADYMHVADDKKIKAMYALLETDMEENVDYTKALKKQLEEGYKHYKNGGKMVTATTVKKQVSKILQNRKQK